MLIGLLEGINSRAAENRAAQAKELETQIASETSILTKLANDATVTPEIRDRASVALLELATNGKRPAKGGYLSQLLGASKLDVHPAMRSVMDFIRTPEVIAGMSVNVPDPSAYSGPTPSAQAPAAQPTIPASQPGGGPPSVTALGAPAGPQSAPSVAPPPPPTLAAQPFDAASLNRHTQTVTTPSVTRPRAIYRDPRDVARSAAIARTQGDLDAKAAALRGLGVPEEEIRQTLIYDIGGRGGAAAGAQSVAGEIVNADGTTTPMYAVFDRARMQYINPTTGEPVANFRPRTSTGSTSMGVDRDAVSMLPAFGGVPYARNTPENRERVDAEVRRRVGEEAFTRTMGTANANAARPFAVDEAIQLPRALANDFEQHTQYAQRTLQQHKVIEEAYRQIIPNLQDGKPIGAQSQALISAFNRMVDELSAVRNEEYNRLPTQQSVFNWIDGWITQVKQGGAGLAAAEIENVAKMATGIRDARLADVKDKAQRTLAQVRSANGRIDLNTVLTPMQQQLLGITAGAPPPPPSSATAPAPASPGAAAPPAGTAPPPPPTASTTPAAPPAGAPPVGAFVGNVYTGERRRDPATGTVYGRTPDGRTVVLTQQNGQWYY